MNVLSTFNGMGCIWYALDRNDIKVNKRYSSEIDKYATQANDAAYSDTIQLGDITKLKVKDLENIDLFVGGSPCQSFSFAGKRKGMATKCEIIITNLDQYLELKESNFEFEGQSYLFWEYMRVLTEIRKYNPNVKFILENVEMGKKWEGVLSAAIGVFGVHINSALISAQNRKRIYWTNIKTKPVGLFGELYSDIPQPKDKGILLKDILQPESEIDDKYYMSDKALKGIINHKETHKEKGNGFGAILRSGNDKHSALLSRDYKGTKDIICVAMRGRNPENPNDKKTEQRLEAKTDGKTNCITSVSKDNLILQINSSKESGGKQPYQQNRVYHTDGIMPALMGENRGKITDGYKLRRLTPRECGKLQTFTDAELDVLLNSGISDSQLYKMFGNGFTVDVIAWIISFLK